MSSSCCRAFGGWLAGCGAATAVLASVIQTFLMIASGGDIARLAGTTVALLPFSFLTFVAVCFLTAIPALMVIWLAELFHARSVVFFGCGGGAVGAFCITLLAPSSAIWIAGLGELFVVAGFVAGATYWAVTREDLGYSR
ncbi:hypothetical protein [Bradyrhizobium sp. NAS96.2]|uniref:hypothetical protein n=1 Tax=Bradyrhizobium sp. NAS96.2 TaxID=1680160 RepID=UPI00093D3CAA|nr:hypothetical protein [Bradyrhizobium sp. NAS96.2]OKO75168.1 hypothetical protein AC628_20850 [Bradyrhizobium sp. NAS96.2]